MTAMAGTVAGLNRKNNRQRAAAYQRSSPHQRCGLTTAAPSEGVGKFVHIRTDAACLRRRKKATERLKSPSTAGKSSTSSQQVPRPTAGSPDVE